MSQTKKIRNPSLILSLVDRVSNSILLAHAREREGGEGRDTVLLPPFVLSESSCLSCHATVSIGRYMFFYISIYMFAFRAFLWTAIWFWLLCNKGINLGAVLFFREGMFIWWTLCRYVIYLHWFTYEHKCWCIPYQSEFHINGTHILVIIVFQWNSLCHLSFSVW